MGDYSVALNFRGPVDPIMEALADAIRPYLDAHAAAEAQLFRYSPTSVRMRIIDPDFRRKSRSERHETLWALLYPLDEDILGELTMLLLLTPEERATSTLNLDFEGPAFAASYSAALKATQESGTPNP